jgi:hypothetical protein
VRAVSIPGVDFGTGGPGGAGNFRVVEPRPIFVRGKLVYLASIIPISANAVSKTVVVDAESNKLVQVFDNDRDPEAEAKTLRYLRTGDLPDGQGETEPTPQGEPAEQPAGGGTGGTGGTGGAGGGDVEERLDRLLDRQRELLEETEALQDALRREREREGAGAAP